MGGSGGGSSGAVEYPDYMKAKHEIWLNGVDAAITAAQSGGSPYAGFTTVDPVTFGTLGSTPASIIDALGAIDFYSDMEGRYNTFNTGDAAISYTPVAVDAAWLVTELPTVYIDTEVATERELLSDMLESETLPRYEAGMLNAGQC